MNASRRQFVTGSLAALGALAGPAGAARSARDIFTPEAFGAKGDGRTNDGDAMAAMAAAVNANSGGTVRFRPTTYLVGGQDFAGRADAGYMFEPRPVLEFTGCSKPLRIEGRGARLKCAPGLHYGIFDIAGAPLHHPMPYIGPGAAAPYRYMLKVERCTGPVEIAHIELDGSLDALRIGGQYGDTGWQIPATGLALLDNRGAESVTDLHSHHHAQDGILISGVDEALSGGPARSFARATSSHNGRQGCSIVGGRGYRFEQCRFAHTGRGRISSMPGAGVDIEAEGGKKNRDFAFIDCSFVDNVGCGLVADTGDSADVDFLRCTFVGTTSWSAWPCKPGFRFDSCTFAGALVRAYGDPDPARAVHFLDCTLTDDPALSPTGALYGGSNPDRPLADLSDAENMLFARCRFLAQHGAVLPWSVHAIYADCAMRQSAPATSFPRGIYLGESVIDGRANLTGSEIRGAVILNGRRYAGMRV